MPFTLLEIRRLLLSNMKFDTPTDLARELIYNFEQKHPEDKPPDLKTIMAHIRLVKEKMENEASSLVK
jgi:hypothetical protein